MRRVHSMLLSTCVTAIVLFHLQLVFISVQVHGQLFDTSLDNTSLSTDEGSGEMEPTMFNTTDYPDVVRADTLPHLVVMDAFGHPCLLATLNATVQISYRVPEGIVHETYVALAEIQLPEDVHAQGVCGENTTRLLLDWGNNTFHVNMTFTKYEPGTETENATWSVTGLAVSYDLSRLDVFPGASETDRVTVERQNLNMFTTPVGFTHACSDDVNVAIGPIDRGVVVNFHEVKIAAFGLTSSEFPPDVITCTEAQERPIEEEILIPLIVACCLSAIVVVIVIAYVISRKIQTSREQSEYKQMP